MSQSVLSTSALAVGYQFRRKPDKIISANLNLTLQAGEMVCLLGPNGAGKSTLMRTLAGLQPGLSGEVLINGENLGSLSAQDLATKLSLVLTERIEAGNLTVTEVVTLGRIPYTGWLGNLQHADREKIQWAMEATGIVGYQHQRISTLSDGERQKVMLSRALAQDTNIIFLDEPTAHLDLPSRVEMMRLLRQLARQMNKAILLSTHELDLALQAADKLWLMKQNGDILAGSPEDLVVNGSFEAVFTKPGFNFDKNSGAFTLHEEPVSFKVYLSGDQLLVFWTKRALQREGLGIVNDENADYQISAVEENKIQKWVMKWSGNVSEHLTIESLITEIRLLKNGFQDAAS